jgi:DNA-binding transcriptional regulator YiaG
MEYKYLGYTFRATTTLHANTMRPLYEIDGLKSRGQKPFLTTVRECRDYIAEHTRTESAELSSSDGAPNAGRMIKSLRTASGMSRPQFAEYFKIPYRTLQAWEIGDREAPEYLVDLIEYKLRNEGKI